MEDTLSMLRNMLDVLSLSPKCDYYTLLTLSGLVYCIDLTQREQDKQKEQIIVGYNHIQHMRE